jgi:hypothetical protein
MSLTSLEGVFGFAKQSAVGTTAGTPYNSTSFVAGSNEVQTITISGTPTGGSFTLTFGGEETDAIPYNATAAQVEAALEALTTIGFNNVACAGGPLPGTGVTVTFQGDLAHENVALLVEDETGLTGGTTPAVTVAQTTAGVADQSAWHWVPATSVNFQPNQIVSNIPPEVGGSLWTRGSYKGGVSGAGQVMMVPRGGLGLAELLRGFCGDVTKTAGNGSNGAAVGNFVYVFTPNGASEELPWYTIVRNTGAWVEEYADARVGSFGFDMAATGILNIDASFISKSCRNIAPGSGATDPGTQVAGNGAPFQAVDVIVRLDTNNSGEPGAAAVTPYKPTRLNIGFANQLSGNEFVIGSHFLQDVTNQARSAMISYSVYVQDAELYNRVYAHGASAAAWSSEIWKGALDVTFRGEQIGATADVYSLRVAVPEMDYQAFPVSLAGNNLVEAQLTANVVLSQNPAVQPFTITYVTDEDLAV